MAEAEFADACPVCGNEITLYGKGRFMNSALRTDGSVKVVCSEIEWICPTCDSVVAITDCNGKPIN